MATYKQYEPHSSEWFEQNLQRFPERTQNAMRVIATMNGNTEVCSSCGNYNNTSKTYSRK